MPNSKKVKYVECECGLWEEMPIDMKNSHSTVFEWITNNPDGTAMYSCTCGDTVVSKIKSQSDEEL